MRQISRRSVKGCVHGSPKYYRIGTSLRVNFSNLISEERGYSIPKIQNLQRVDIQMVLQRLGVAYNFYIIS